MQKEYGKKFKEIIELKKRLSQSQNRLANLFNTLLQKALKGELNFRNSEEPLLAAEEAAVQGDGKMTKPESEQQLE